MSTTLVILLLPTLLSLSLLIPFDLTWWNIGTGVEALTVTMPSLTSRSLLLLADRCCAQSTTRISTREYRHDRTSPLSAKRSRGRLNNDDDDEYYYYDDDDDDDNGYYYEDDVDSPTRPRPRRKRMDLGRSGLEEENNLEIASPFGMPKGVRLPQPVSQALLAGVFVLGIGTGVTVDSQINTSPKDLASRDAVDQAAPNPRICSTYGASAMAFDQRVFVSFNPFNVYVAQADVKPACVLRESNVVSVLQDRGLINSKEVRACKQNMNTWAYVGDLNDYPQLSCVYKSEDAQNEFLSNPKYGIGEDVWDDDREVMEAVVRRSTSKKIKDGMTEGEKVVYEKALKLKKDAAGAGVGAVSGANGSVTSSSTSMDK